MCLTVFRTLRRLVSSSSIRDILLKAGCAAGIACLYCLAFFPTEAPAQGVSPITKEQYAAIPRWQPDPQGVGEMPRVDLREFLPPVGNQGRNNDCVAWAVGYACKTYMETRQNKWNPVEINHQFSPSFVYNLLNSGHDRGIQVFPALDLLIKRGCATLATMPYDGD